MQETQRSQTPTTATSVSGTLLATLLVYATAALSGPLAARLLGPEGRGTLAAIQLWPTALAMVAMLGLPDAIVYFGARHPDRAAQWLLTAQAIALAAACGAACLGYPIVSIALRNYDPAVIRAAHIYLLLIPLTVFAGIPIHLARALGHFGLFNFWRVLPTFGWLTILVLSFSRRPVTAETLSSAYLLFVGVEAVVVTAICMRRFWTNKWFSYDAGGKLFKYGTLSALGAVPQLLNLRLDQMVISALLSPTELGLYVVASSWAGIAGIALLAVGPVLFQRVASEHEVANARALVCRASRAALIVGAIGGTLFALITVPLLGVIYGNAFRSALPVTLVLVAANVIGALNTVLEDGLRGLGHPSTVLRAETCGLFVTAAALWALLGPFNIVGAALASLLGYCGVTAVLTGSLSAQHNVTARQILRPGVADVYALLTMARTVRLGAIPQRWREPFHSCDDPARLRT